MMKGWSIALLWVVAPVGVLGEGITLQQSWKENSGKLPLGLNSTGKTVPGKLHQENSTGKTLRGKLYQENSTRKIVLGKLCRENCTGKTPEKLYWENCTGKIVPGIGQWPNDAVQLLLNISWHYCYCLQPYILFFCSIALLPLLSFSIKNIKGLHAPIYTHSIDQVQPVNIMKLLINCPWAWANRSYWDFVTSPRSTSHSAFCILQSLWS